MTSIEERVSQLEAQIAELTAREAERQKYQRDRIRALTLNYSCADEWLPTSEVIKLGMIGINANLLRNREKHGWEEGVHYRQFGARNLEYNVPVICHWKDHTHDPSAHIKWLRERQKRAAMSYSVPD